jgi:Leishmanolysin
MKAYIGLLILILISTSHQMERPDFVQHLHISRSQAEIAMDRIVPIHSANHNNGLGEFHPLKIHADVQGIQHLKGSNPKMYSFMLDTLIPACVKHMSDTFRVREQQQTAVTVGKCVDLPVPEVMKTPKNVDLILFFTAEALKTDGFVAWAYPCQMHRTTMRPTAGRVNMNPFHLSYDRKLFFRSVCYHFTRNLPYYGFLQISVPVLYQPFHFKEKSPF